MNRTMGRACDLLAIGDPCADLVFRTERLPAWDDKARGEALGLFGGGTEANAACVAARLGWRSALFGQTGDDLHADFIRRDLAGHGVMLQHLRRCAGSASSLAIVAVSPQGERSVVWLPPGGALPADAAATRPLLDAALADSRWAYTMPYAAEPLADLAVRTARSGTRLAIDLEREGVLSLDSRLPTLLLHCDIAFLNRSGFEAATGTAPDAASLKALCRMARAHTVVVTLGADGAMAADRDEGFATQAACPAAVVDATGAGDTFNASFLVARDRGALLGSALAQACRAASRSVAVWGARGALATFQPADAGRDNLP
ncbi:carbohydrate kinase family protein [Aquabacterium sp.]|uniref:carbohydrate kinase family protein n=1 Tax=Aquabacterium sp. TaxID=1872578 RepID=UPI002CA1179D|nr:carbohydrate kinase family protein [Aquabacterium sp.]HSW04073.1 carbohydrate kinase family protein [Aquabacterium sp.]